MNHDDHKNDINLVMIWIFIFYHGIIRALLPYYATIWLQDIHILQRDVWNVVLPHYLRDHALNVHILNVLNVWSLQLW